MLYNERIELILQQLQLQGIVKISDLTELLGVSVDTVRRDLKTMEQNNLVRCVRGGACLPDSLASISGFSGRQIVNEGLKREAARKAAAYVKTGSVIALNSGTTNTILAQELAVRSDKFTVITNNMAAVQILMQNPSIDLIAVGGMIDGVEKSTYGSVCEQEFDRYYPDIAFLSINAVNYQDGFTDFRFYEIPVIQLLARRAGTVMAVMDSGKLGKRSKQKVLSFDKVDKLLMDNKVSDKLKEEYDKVVRSSFIKASKERVDSFDSKDLLHNQQLHFKEECMAICSNEEALCNIVVDLCYKKSNKSKQFAWELCGEKMVENLLKHHDYKISYPTKDENGDIEFRGQRFKMEELILCD